MSKYKKIFLFFLLSLVFLFGMYLYQSVTFNDGKLHVVFCNVGQGDAIFIRTPKGVNMLIDGGPDDSVLDCISHHMVLFDHQFSMVMLTHPHTDHFIGLIPVLQRYRVHHFVTEKLANTAAGFKELQSVLIKENIQIQYVHFPNAFSTKDKVHVAFLGPTETFLTTSSPNGTVGESGEFASLLTFISFGICNILLTGDSQARELQEGIEGLGGVNGLENGEYVLQVPHHGSATGLTQEILDQLQPKLAVISVGENNRYKHPAKATIQLLKEHGIAVARTDKDGEVEIVTDGKACSYK